MTLSFSRLTALAAGLALIAGCAGEPTSPQLAPAAAAQADLLASGGGVVNGLVSVSGVLRASPLASSITVSKTIGSGGGTLSIPAAGVSVTVPSGALASNTVITMTAREGSLVAYDFAPHGITFAKPLVITQELQGTNVSVASSALLKLGYYADPSQLTAVGGLVSELIGGTVDLLNWSFTSSITHFSGYMVSCGRASEEE